MAQIKTEFDPFDNPFPNAFDTRCGEVFLSSADAKFLFICTFCNSTFVFVEKFIDHIKNGHWKNECASNEKDAISHLEIALLNEPNMEMEPEDDPINTDIEPQIRLVESPIDIKLDLDENEEYIDTNTAMVWDNGGSEEDDDDDDDIEDPWYENFSTDTTEPRKKIEAQFITEMIEYYKKFPCLWKKKTAESSNAKLRSVALKIIEQQVYKKYYPEEAHVLAVRDKLNNLKIYFRRELRKMKAAPNKNETYVPRIWYFDKLLFLADVDKEETNDRDDEDDSEMSTDVPETYNCSLCPPGTMTLPSTDELYVHLRDIHLECDPNSDPFEEVAAAGGSNSKRLPRKFLEEFIELYQTLPCLWEVKSEFYYDKEVKAKAYDTLAEKLKELEPQNATKHGVKRKILIIRGMFRREEKKVQTAKENDEDYQPLWYYEKLKFLQPHVDFRSMKKGNTDAGEKSGERSTDAFQCRKCRETFPNKCTLIKHRLKLHSKMRVMCEVCGKVFSQLFDLKEHKYIHTGERPYECETCGKKFGAMRNLSSHERLHSGKEFPCEICGVTMGKKEYLADHLKRHTQQYAYKCRFCDKQCLTSSALSSHMKMHNDDTPFACDICGAQFKRRSSLQNHTQRHLNQFDIKCELCDKTCATNGDLKSHMRSHSDERPYVCDICGKRFKRQVNWSDHHARRHLKIAEHKCELCEKSFYTKRACKEHVDAEHINVKTEFCEICGESFYRRRSMLRHRNSHFKK